MSITSIENLSNELFYEMFYYLDGFDISEAFSNLNYRFQQLLKSSSVLFQITLDSTFDEFYAYRYEQFILIHKDQIFSAHLSISSEEEHFFSFFPINASLNRLESLVLRKMDPPILCSLLPDLICLPRLFSLTIDMEYNSEYLDDIYQSIFTLPKLKYLKCLAEESDVNVSIPFALNNQYSTIENLIINHSCTFDELSVILSYTPELRRLNFSQLDESALVIGTLLPTRLSNLTHIFLNVPYITFNEFKIFITSLECKLKTLRFTTRSADVTYMDAYRWEELILKYFPQLKQFYFQYCEETDDECEFLPYIEDVSQFTSSFWIGQKWIFETAMNSVEVKYSIHPYK